MMNTTIRFALIALLAGGAFNALAQDDSAAAKRKQQQYGLDTPGRSSGQGLRGPDATPDKKEKRGNTPPGADRAGDGPASGAIVDPAGVTKK